MTVASFDSVQPSLKSLLDNVATGKMQLPDFQRGWVWDDEHIKSLIASVSLSFPIGALMTLDTGSADLTFKPRPVEGTDDQLQQVNPETLILDGQQRLTSLFQSLMAKKAVETKDAKGKKIKRWYYLDMKKCVDDTIDREDAVLSVSEDRLVMRDFGREIELDLSSPEKEYENEMFPVDRLFDSDRWLRACTILMKVKTNGAVTARTWPGQSRFHWSPGPLHSLCSTAGSGPASRRCVPRPSAAVAP